MPPTVLEWQTHPAQLLTNIGLMAPRTALGVFSLFLEGTWRFQRQIRVLIPDFAPQRVQGRSIVVPRLRDGQLSATGTRNPDCRRNSPLDKTPASDSHLSLSQQHRITSETPTSKRIVRAATHLSRRSLVPGS